MTYISKRNNLGIENFRTKLITQQFYSHFRFLFNKIYNNVTVQLFWSNFPARGFYLQGHYNYIQFTKNN